MLIKHFLSVSLTLCSYLSFGQNTILWKITNTNSKHTSYLLGSYHLFGSSFVDTYPVIKEKLSSCELVVTETEINRIKIAEYYNSRNYSDTLSSVLSKEDLNFILSLFKTRGINIFKFTPGELYMKLLSYYPKYKCKELSETDSLTMDEYVQFLGSQYQKHLYYFETDLFQLSILSEISKQYDWPYFKNIIPTVLAKYKDEHPNKNSCALVKQYASLKLDYHFEDTCNVLEAGNINDVVLRDRNAEWMKKLPNLLDEQNCFITVGLLHLYNKCGLIQQLQILGYNIEPVKLK